MIALDHVPPRRGRSPSRPSDLLHLGHDIWVSEGVDGPPTRIIAGRAYSRFLDVLYLPVATHRLTAQQVFTINRYRNRIVGSDPQFGYNRQLKSILASVVSQADGRVLELGPGPAPILTPGARFVLSDLDEEANAANARAGYSVLAPSRLGSLAPNSIQLIVAAFVLHFHVGRDQAQQLVDLLDPAGLIVFNVVSRSAATRTSAVSRLSRAGLRFRSIELGGLLGKSDVLFVGTKSDAPSAFKTRVETLLAVMAEEADGADARE